MVGPHLRDARHDRRDGLELGADRRPRAGGRARSCRCPGGPHSSIEARWPRLTDRRSGPRSPTRCAWPDELLERARAHPCGERLPLGRRLEQGLGPGAGDGAPGGHGRDGRPRRRQRRSRITSETSIRIHRASRIGEQDGGDPDDVLHVARDVGVLSARRGRRATRRARPRPRGSGGARGRAAGRLGGLLLGQQLGLELGARAPARHREPGGRGRRPRPRRGCAGAGGGSAVDGPALAGTDAAAGALRHGGVGASSAGAAGAGRRRQRIHRPAGAARRGRAGPERRGDRAGSDCGRRAGCYARPARPERTPWTT